MENIQGVEAARSRREASIAPYAPALQQLPTPLPRNVQGIADTILTPEELAITQLDPGQIVEKTKSRELSCVAVTTAFLKRAALAQRLVNCLTELLPEHALERAKYLDSLPEPQGPLFGVPISVKEQFGFEGGFNDNGYVAFADRQQRPLCSLNARLEQAGAIIFARTNQPQTVMHLETNNNIYGRTLNPWNTDLTCGGSSGGEGALVGFLGSPLGVGGDIGGSIRSPAANNGVYGFKPSPFRIGNTGAMSAIVGQEGITGVMGPLSRSRDGLELFMKSYLETSPWIEENTLVPIPWRQVDLPSRLKIGVIWSDGIVRPHPPIQRALRMVVENLQKSGTQVVDWNPVKHDECWELTNSLYYEDGGRRHLDLISKGEEEALPLTKWLLEENNVKPRTVEEVWDLKARRNEYRSMYNKLWLSTGAEDGHPIDAILCPVGPGCAPPHDTAKYWNYTSQWNLLDYPCAVFPVTQVDVALDQAKQAYEPMNDKDQFNYGLYTGPERYLNAPVSLQLVTRKYEDEKCLAILQRIEEAMGR